LLKDQANTGVTEKCITIQPCINKNVSAGKFSSNNSNLYSHYSGTKERWDKKETIENEMIEII